MLLTHLQAPIPGTGNQHKGTPAQQEILTAYMKFVEISCTLCISSLQDYALGQEAGHPACLVSVYSVCKIFLPMILAP